MKTMLKRTILLLLAMMLIVPSALADFDVVAALQARTSYAYSMTDGRAVGPCSMLRGDIELSVVLVTVDDTPWTPDQIADVLFSVDGATQKLHEEAAGYGVTVNITPSYYRAYSDASVDTGNWFDRTIATVPGLADQDDWSDHAILFCLNIPGRSFARPGSSSKEYVIFYVDREPSTVRHELLHLFGAEDFYYHDGVEAAAEEYFPNTIMIYSYEDSATVDPLTAYLVGWMDEPDETTNAFLAEISGLSTTEVAEAHSLDQQTGTGSISLGSGTYYGTLEMGMADGAGILEDGEGGSYVGDWTMNRFDGQGTLTWADGSSYTGDFVEDKRTGKGTYVGVDGMTYTGDFVDGRYTGKGTATWPTGESYTGDFIGGRRTGKGTFTWADGRTYTGDFLNDTITGMGMMTYANGDVYIGQFQNGEMHGIGTMYYADGTIVNGTWNRNTYVGP